MTTFDFLLNVKAEQGGGYLVLLDPDRLSEAQLVHHAVTCAECGVDALLIGSSLLIHSDFGRAVKVLKEAVNLPLLIFPGGVHQISPDADAILFLSMISGRNPDLLIGEHVRAAPIIKRYGLETIPTGYLLIESGTLTTVECMSGTRPLPRNKRDIAMAHALAVEYLGMHCLYLDAGSGAALSVPEEMIAAIRGYVSLPIIVGGGIREPDVARRKIEAGASFVVIGNAVEEHGDKPLIRAFAEAIHIRS
ncbi:MAG: geranylgeranylglyceryl/heptaprenylglyceryl phosphate synthase [Candidatus Latescibacteria bacterium]|nr:geranylgeranylglyceryl/heptaprenylglyceryl phosphate synthase [Candidatus Latescibacterota bacterium]